MSKWVYDFAEGSREMRELLGGKGAGIAEMTRVLGAERVPAGFTVTTEACVEYMRADKQEPEGMAEQVAEAIARLEQHAGKRLGDPSDPLLVSVRSGARESMPGMMDSVLNLGMGDEVAAGIARASGNERFAWDSYRRFVQMFGNVVRGIPGDRFEDAIREAKDARGVKLDTELDVDALSGDLPLGPEVMQLPAQLVDQPSPGVRQPFAMQRQQPNLELDAGEPGCRQRLNSLSQASAGDRERVDRVRLAALPDPLPSVGHQPRREPDNRLTAIDQEPLEAAGYVANVLDHPRPLAVKLAGPLQQLTEPLTATGARATESPVQVSRLVAGDRSWLDRA